jgi:hypothetical protein
MTNYTAADIALILDPERKCGWWQVMQWCNKCGRDHAALDTIPGCPYTNPSTYGYTGPDFLHDDTACFRWVRPVLLRAGMRIRETLGGCVIQHATPFGYDLVEDGTDGYAAATCAALVWARDNMPDALARALEETNNTATR